MKASKSKPVVVGVTLGCIIVLIGCQRPTNPGTPSTVAGQRTITATRQGLSPKDAAELAARLANEQCEHQYRRRPFKPDQYSAVLNDGRYQWGGLDVGGVGGFSALVTFLREGSEPHVEVYFSSDALGLR
jgi:hypothetical protein